MVVRIAIKKVVGTTNRHFGEYLRIRVLISPSFYTFLFSTAYFKFKALKMRLAMLFPTTEYLSLLMSEMSESVEESKHSTTKSI